MKISVENVGLKKEQKTVYSIEYRVSSEEKKKKEKKRNTGGVKGDRLLLLLLRVSCPLLLIVLFNFTPYK